jgi:hypothetical protein
VPGEKLVFSVTAGGVQKQYVQYVFKSGIIIHAQLTWVIPATVPAALASKIDASMATFKLNEM